MKNFQIYSIGRIRVKEEGFYIMLEPKYVPALKALDGFGNINIIWWLSDFDNKEDRSILEVRKPYKNAPEEMGIFATRSPIRPNPIALSSAKVIHINYEKGIVQIAYIDANDGTPVLDIKPYTPSLDRLENPLVPGWCSHWPKSIEGSANFDWDDEFNF